MKVLIPDSRIFLCNS